MRDVFPELVEKHRTGEMIHNGKIIYPKTNPGEKNGIFTVPANGNIYKFLISDGAEWDHVSVSINRKRLLQWHEMCWAKDLFFEDEEVVVQFHPKKSEYVNMAAVLHLWRYQGEFPRPPSYMVGI